MFGPGTARDAVQKVATRLRFPQAFAVFVTLFVLDLVFPDMIPFIDEILLGLAAALFGLWREPLPREPGPAGGKPPEKNVTPPR